MHSSLGLRGGSRTGFTPSRRRHARNDLLNVASRSMIKYSLSLRKPSSWFVNSRAIVFIPRFVRMGGAAREVDAACFQLHDKEQVERCQATRGPGFHCREVDGCHYVPVRFQECLPGPCTAACRCRFNAVALRMLPMVESQMW